jgi:hypothetical protein
MGCFFCLGFLRKLFASWAWWLAGSAVTPALRRPRQEDLEFKARLGYIARNCPKQINK